MNPRDNELLELLISLQKKGDISVTVISGLELAEYTGIIDQIFDDCYLVLNSSEEIKVYIPINCIYKIIYYADDHRSAIFERV